MDVLADLRSYARDLLVHRGYYVRYVPLKYAPALEELGQSDKFIIIEGRQGDRLAVAVPVKFPDIRLEFRRLAWVLGTKRPAVPELVLIVIPEDLPYTVEAGAAGLRTTIEVVRARGVRLGWVPRKPQESEYGLFLRARPSPVQVSLQGGSL